MSRILPVTHISRYSEFSIVLKPLDKTLFDVGNNNISIKEGKYLDHDIEINGKIPVSIRSLLHRNKHQIMAVVEFNKTRYRKYIELDFKTSDEFTIELMRDDIYQNGSIDFIAINKTNGKIKRISRIGKKWVITVDNLAFESDFLFRWRNFTEPEFASRYSQYDQIILDFHPRNVKPIIYINSGVPGLYELLNKENFRGKNLTYQKLIFQIIYNHVMYGSLIFDFITFSKEDTQLISRDIFGDDNRADQLVRRLSIAFGMNERNKNEIIDMLNSLLTDKGNSEIEDVISTIIFNIQENSGLRDLVQRILEE